MNINLLNSQQQNRQLQYKQQSPNFKGGTALLDYLVTNPVWGATATDVISMGGPRTIIDAKNRGLNGGLETGVREFSSTANDASVGAYGLLAGTLIAGMLKPMGLKDPQRIFASNESLDVHNAKWQAHNGNIDNFVNDYVNSLEGFNPNHANANADGYVKIADADKPKIVEDLKALANKDIAKEERNTLQKRLATRLIEATGADNQMLLKHGDKSVVADSKTVLDDFFRLTKAFQEKKVDTPVEKLISTIKKFGKTRALLGLGFAMAISSAVQPLNVWMTKKRTGCDGFAGMADRTKDNSTEFKMMKGASALGMAGLALATMKAKPSQILDKVMYTSAIPSMNQIKALFGITIMSRMLSARDKDELGETNRKDILGYLNWLIIGNLINKGYLMSVQDKNNPLVRVSEADKNKTGIKGVMSRFFNSNVSTRREVLVQGMKDAGKSAINENGVSKTITEMMKELPKNSVARKNIKLLNIGQLINYGYTIAVLGYGLPKLNIAITNKAQARRKAEKEAMVKNAVMTDKNQQFVNDKSGYGTFTSFKSNKVM